jgi:hypothetical protein
VAVTVEPAAKVERTVFTNVAEYANVVVVADGEAASVTVKGTTTLLEDVTVCAGACESVACEVIVAYTELLDVVADAITNCQGLNAGPVCSLNPRVYVPVGIMLY